MQDRQTEAETEQASGAPHSLCQMALTGAPMDHQLCSRNITVTPSLLLQHPSLRSSASTSQCPWSRLPGQAPVPVTLQSPLSVHLALGSFKDTCSSHTGTRSTPIPSPAPAGRRSSQDSSPPQLLPCTPAARVVSPACWHLGAV